ncbi:MAG TPA: PQQ-dependent sugar dehydrogenase [Rhizomicrobium sp.]|nr:PQQ-dependent sugar dehydrogenase [Rhizomicrobium sp.]
MGAFRIIGALVLAAGLAGTALAATHTLYKTTDATCDGWPRAPIGMAAGYCAGIVGSPQPDYRSRTLRIPRLLLALPGGKDWLVTDLGDWDAKRGKVFRITASRGQPTTLTPLLTHLVMPHGLARGPDGKVYVGEMSRIFRFDPDAKDPQSTIEPVIAYLPNNKLHENRHPLSFFIFDTNGDMLVNVGAPSDQCLIDGKPNGTTKCQESEGDEPSAVIRRYRYLGDGKWDQNYIVIARGLRNSLALALHSSGTLLQAENSIDYPTKNEPFEELNVIRYGAHYGWPYCYDMAEAAPAWTKTSAMNCNSAAHEKPVRLLPPHVAPLGMLYYNGAMFPQLAGHLIMTWHGYEPTGARIAAFAVDERGIPLLASRARYTAYANATGDKTTTRRYPGAASDAVILTPGWNRIDDERPRGAPVGLAVAEDGAIWVTDDKNGTILRIAPDRP